LSLRTGETRVELAGSDRRGGRALADFYYVVPLRASLDSAAEPEWEEDWNSILFAADEFEVVVESWEPGEPVSLTAVAWDLGRFRSTGTWSGTPEAADAEEEESEEPYEPAR
jgi:hypothetical protein